MSCSSVAADPGEAYLEPRAKLSPQFLRSFETEEKIERFWFKSFFYLLLHLLDLISKLLDLLLVLLLLSLTVLEDGLPLPLHQLDLLFHLRHLLENCSPGSPSVSPRCKSLHLRVPAPS